MHTRVRGRLRPDQACIMSLLMFLSIGCGTGSSGPIVDDTLSATSHKKTLVNAQGQGSPTGRKTTSIVLERAQTAFIAHREIQVLRVDVEGSSGMLTWAQDPTPSRRPIVSRRLVIEGQDGRRHEVVFDGGATIFFDTALDDGHYRWTLTRRPALEASEIEKLQAARSTGDLKTVRNIRQRLEASGAIPSRLERQGNVRTGSFTLVSGALASPNVLEISPRTTTSNIRPNIGLKGAPK